MPRVVSTIFVCLLGALTPAWAHHRQTPPIVRMSPSEDAVDFALPRVPSFDGALGLLGPAGVDEQLILVRLYPIASDAVLEATGDNRNPAVALNGAAIAWDSDSDPLGTGAVGRQVYYHNGASIVQLSHDPTGTSANPAVSGSGQWVAFQSAGDLAGTGASGVTQIFLAQVFAGTLVQVTSGAGPSTNPALDRLAKSLAYESTTDPGTGLDTGLAQVWLADLRAGTQQRVTDGLGPSGNPTMDLDGKLVAFESQADLAGTGTDTGVPQIFVYSPKTATFAQITADPGGCTGPSVHKFRSDFRIAYVCGGQAYYTLLRANTRWRVQVDVPGSSTTGIVAGFGPYFVLVHTTADLLDGTGTTAGHQVYLVNLFKRAAAPVAGSTTWFPSQGIPPLRSH
ncbi:MAG TPA: hypothetical protein VKW76_11100 [Candidatus Binatia bacterium]|nr:hypothetical protein [Candidatus Binatia bacterium]